MIQKLIHWVRLVLPRFEWVAVFVIVMIGFEAINLSVIASGWNPNDGHFRELRLALYVAIGLIYGVYRVAAFHPRSNAEYERWLSSTPWTSQHPLPYGPINLIPQDLLVILALMAFSQYFTLRVLYIPVAFLTGHQLALASINWSLKEWALAYAVGFGLGAQCFFFRQPEWQLLIGIACYPLSWIASQRVLSRFPWEPEKFSILERTNQMRLGWPHDTLAPKQPHDLICRHDALCLSFLMGWWHLAILWGADQDIRPGILLFPWAILMAAGFIRILSYIFGYNSPIDLWGRICTGRWIIPKYDCIWIPSLVAWLIGTVFYSGAFFNLIKVTGFRSEISFDSTNLIGWYIRAH